MGKSSKIWTGYYEAVNLKTNSAVVVCKKCSREYDHPRWKSGSSTSTIQKHYNKHHETKPQVTSAESIERYVQAWPGASALTQLELDALLLETLAACNWSFN